MKSPQDTHICCILNNPAQTYWALCAQGMRDLAHEHGMALSIRPAYTLAETQSEAQEALNQSDVDAVIIAGTDFFLTNHYADHPPRVPLVTCSGTLGGAAPACDVKPDLRRAAELAATYLVEQLQGQGSVIHIQGFPNEAFTLPRSQGFAAVIECHPGMRVVVEADGNFDRSAAARVMRAALAERPDLQAVFAHSDEMALGALDALEAAGRSNAIVVGIDAIPQSLAAIHAGTMAATVELAPYTLGRTALAHTLQILQGAAAPAAVLTDVRLITAANLLEATLDTIRVMPTVLRDLVEGGKAQRQLQEEIIATQRRLIQDLSTPVIPVSDSILVVPLIGAIDSLRAAQITHSLLEAVGRRHAQVLIIDITGVSVVDTNVLNYLIQTARAVRLLGSRVLLVGIGPEVAQTIVQLGIDLSSIVTRSTLQAGLEYAVATQRR